MWPVSSTLLAALQQGGVPFAPRVTVTAPTGPIDVPILDDSSGVTASVGQQVGRTADLAVDRSVTDAGLFNPLTDIVTIRFVIPSQPDIPLFVGRPTDLVETDRGHVQVRLNDLSDDVVYDEFITPWYTIGGTYGQEVTRLFNTASTGFGVDVSRVPAQVAPILTWDTGRGQALDDLTAGVNCLWQADRGGSFVVYLNPFTVSSPVSVLAFTDGVNGTMVGVTRTRSRTNVYNAVTLVVERTDGSLPPLRVTVFDNDPASPTLYGGSFGRRNRVVHVQGVSDTSTATAVAVRLLQQYLALAETWQVDTPFMPILDQGDVITVTYRNAVTQLMVESVSYNLTAQRPTRVTARRLQTVALAKVGVL